MLDLLPSPGRSVLQVSYERAFSTSTKARRVHNLSALLSRLSTRNLFSNCSFSSVLITR